MQKFIISAAFGSLRPPLPRDEYLVLEQSILNEGCREPLTLWHKIVTKVCRYCLETFDDDAPHDLCHCRYCDHHYPHGECHNCHRPIRQRSDMLQLDVTPVLLDGYSRYEICKRHHVPYQVVSVQLYDEIEAKLWAIERHLQHTDLTPARSDSLHILQAEYLEAKKIQSAAGEQLLITTGQLYLPHRIPLWYRIRSKDAH